MDGQNFVMESRKAEAPSSPQALAGTTAHPAVPSELASPIRRSNARGHRRSQFGKCQLERRAPAPAPASQLPLHLHKQPHPGPSSRNCCSFTHPPIHDFSRSAARRALRLSYSFTHLRHPPGAYNPPPEPIAPPTAPAKTLPQLPVREIPPPPAAMAETGGSPIGIANLPNQRHKIVAKRGAAFTIMVAGESGLGKTTFINTLFSTTIKNYADHKRRHAKQIDKTVEIEITKAELEEKFFKVRLTVIDTPGFGDYVNNRDSWQPIIEFLDDQHESYMLQEQQPKRSDKIDLRVHACLFFIRPTGHTLKPLDIEVMKRLATRVNLIPVIAKADTLSPADLARFKHRIRSVIEAQGIKIYTPPLEEDDEAGLQHARSLISAMPFSVIGSERDVTTPDGRTVKGRHYHWGVAEVENEEHCDFKKLRAILIRTHMLDLIHTTEENHYEVYRAQQMETRKFGEARPRKLDNPKFKEEEEALRKRFTEQVKVEEQRFRQWEQKLIAERDRLNKDLEQSHAVIKQLEAEVETLQGSMSRTGRR
ncbi:Septin spn4 [Cercospora beticola]|uniref:Septin spn4 n=3 Tax=Cercospora TaxID=29002 RepID=A0ABZ0P362_CERBT|nr:Septin spn4 [Cercospora beticola]